MCGSTASPGNLFQCLAFEVVLSTLQSVSLQPPEEEKYYHAVFQGHGTAAPL